MPAHLHRRHVMSTLAVVGALAVGSATAAVADPEHRRIPPAAVVPDAVTVDADPARLTYSREARSPWRVDIDADANVVVARHDDGPSLVIDYDDQADDRHFVGISPDTGCGPMEGEFWGSRTSLIYPVLDPEEHLIEDVTVHAGRDGLEVRMSGGSYTILDPAADDEPLFTDARFTVDGEGLAAELSGLYYIMPSKHPGTSLILRTESGEELHRSYTMGSPTGREYIDDVRQVDVSDGAYGDYRLTTDVERLQIDVNANPLLDVFELDSDHAFKDLGQRVVTTELAFARSCGA